MAGLEAAAWRPNPWPRGSEPRGPEAGSLSLTGQSSGVWASAGERERVPCPYLLDTVNLESIQMNF